jgi:bifunctional non-homologous end joining protein LigD
MGLAVYKRKRDFEATPEPAPSARPPQKAGAPLSFVVQRHDASSLHYDFRLELDGVLLSWAVPKGPSLDPSEKRLAVRTEDHPLAYGGFAGTIPKGHYGAGKVAIWDRGSWLPRDDPHAGLRQGKMVFTLRGRRLKGSWALVRTRLRNGSKKPEWLLMKQKDEAAVTKKK